LFVHKKSSLTAGNLNSEGSTLVKELHFL